MKPYDAPDPRIYWDTWAPQEGGIEAHWQALNALDPKKQAEVVCTYVDQMVIKPARARIRGVHWRVVIPQLPFSKELIDEFWKKFSEPDAVRSREYALKGIVLTRLEPALKVVESARRAFEPVKAALRSREEPLIRYLEVLEKDCKSHADLGLWFADRLDAGDYQIFEMIVKILKDGIDPPPDAKGGPGSDDGKILKIFVDLHVTGRTLPRKSEILEKFAQHKGSSLSECDLIQRQALSKQVSKSLKKLGLAGLPA